MIQYRFFSLVFFVMATHSLVLQASYTQDQDEPSAAEQQEIFDSLPKWEYYNVVTSGGLASYTVSQQSPIEEFEPEAHELGKHKEQVTAAAAQAPEKLLPPKEHRSWRKFVQDANQRDSDEQGREKKQKIEKAEINPQVLITVESIIAKTVELDASAKK